MRDVRAGQLVGYDAVLCLAALSNDPLGNLNPAATYSVNLDGTLHLARMAKQAGVTRFLFSSSCSLYGSAGSAAVAEDAPMNPVTPYGETKIMAERELSKLADDNFSPTYLRNATAYGASTRLRLDIVVNNLTAVALTTGQVRLESDGTPWRPLVHVEDICEAILLALEAPREAVHNQVFNVGSDEQNYRIREIAEIVAEAFPGCVVTYGPPSADNRSYRVSFGKIRRHLPGFRCRWTADRGARQLREIFESIAMSKEVFNYRAFTRLQQLKYLVATRQIDEQFFFREPAGRAAEA